MSAEFIRALVEFPVEAFQVSSHRVAMYQKHHDDIQKQHRPSRNQCFGTTGMEPTFKVITPENIHEAE